MKASFEKRKYNVEYQIYFLKADKPGPGNTYHHEMVLDQPVSEPEVKGFFEEQLARRIAGFNEYPPEEVAVEITKMVEIIVK